MGFGIISSIRGASARELELEVISNNISNINTPGYREMNVSFSSELNNISPDDPILAKAQANIKNGVTYLNLSSGGASRTDNPTDFAIQGNGYFVVETPKGERYTRNGSFNLDNQGRLVTPNGDVVLGESGAINITPGQTFHVNELGDVILDEGEEIVDRLRVRDFQNPQQLKPEGSSYYADSTGQFAENPQFRIMQGHLENSNVSLIDNMTRIIQVSRAYESIQKTMKQQVEAGKMLNQLPKMG